jgi:hypothetical protein
MLISSFALANAYWYRGGRRNGHVELVKQCEVNDRKKCADAHLSIRFRGFEASARTAEAVQVFVHYDMSVCIIHDDTL